MRLSIALLVLSLSYAALFAAAPPPKAPEQWLKLIDQLGDDETHADAAKKLEALGEDAIPVLRRAGRQHGDVDVRLRAAVVADAIEKMLWGEVRKFEGHKDGVLAFALSPDGKKMVSGAWQNDSDHVARVWDLETGKELMKLEGHKGSVGGLAWSPDGKRILTASDDRNLILWDAANGKPLETLTGHLSGAWQVKFSLDGKMA